MKARIALFAALALVFALGWMSGRAWLRHELKTVFRESLEESFPGLPENRE